MNEEVRIAVDELRQMPRNRQWFIPAILDQCEVPDFEIGGGETLESIHRIDLSNDFDEGLNYLIKHLKDNGAD